MMKRIFAKRPNRILNSVIAGTLIAMAATTTLYLLEPAREMEVEPLTEPTPPAHPVKELTQAKQKPEKITPIIENKETRVEAKRPVVALSHDDDETDFLSLAEQQMAEGEMKDAFQSLRRHLWNNEPTPEVLLKLGVIGRELKSHAIAEQALLDAGGLDPTRSAIPVELSRILLEVGELKRARHAARQGIRLDRNNASAWNLAGRVAMAESHWQRSEMAFRHSLELDPTNAMIHNNIGLLYIMMKDADSAIDALETSVELFEDDAPYFVFNNLGLAHELAENMEEAREAFEEALLVNPFYSRAKVNLNRVETAVAARAEESAFQTARADELIEAFDDGSFEEDI